MTEETGNGKASIREVYDLILQLRGDLEERDVRFRSELTRVTQRVDGLEQSRKVATIILGIILTPVVASLIALLWGIFTNRVELVFR